MSRPSSPQLAQQRMLREVLLKAVENLRRNQRRNQGQRDEQEMEELQLQSQPSNITDNISAVTSGEQQKCEAVSGRPKLRSADKDDQQNDTTEKAVQGKPVNLIISLFRVRSQIIKMYFEFNNVNLQ